MRAQRRSEIDPTLERGDALTSQPLVGINKDAQLVCRVRMETGADAIDVHAVELGLDAVEVLLVELARMVVFEAVHEPLQSCYHAPSTIHHTLVRHLGVIARRHKPCRVRPEGPDAHTVLHPGGRLLRMT